jgi:hypothetical protein
MQLHNYNLPVQLTGWDHCLFFPVKYQDTGKPFESKDPTRQFGTTRGPWGTMSGTASDSTFLVKSFACRLLFVE